MARANDMKSCSKPASKTRSSSSLDAISKNPAKPPQKIEARTTYHIGSKKVTANTVFDTFWYYAAERQSIYNKRLRGESRPWTKDPVLRDNRFCNTFRVTDATCQFIIDYCIKAGSKDPKELVFRVVLFDTFTRIETWELLVEHIGFPTWQTYNRNVYARVLRSAKNAGTKLYTGSFQKPAPHHGYAEAFMNHLVGLEMFMKADLPKVLIEATTMAEVYNWLREFNGMGEFNAYQLLLNLSYTGLGHFEDADSFVVLGLGARAGLKRAFGTGISRKTELAIVQWMYRTQDQHLKRLHLDCVLEMPGQPTQRLGVCDIEHTWCEVEKYVRQSSSKAAYVKRKFRPTNGPTSQPTLPPDSVEDSEERWVVARISGQRTRSSTVEYQVFWEGYAEPTWEPADTITEDAPSTVAAFLRRNHKSRR